jgi:hypothetical protein
LLIRDSALASRQLARNTQQKSIISLKKLEAAGVEFGARYPCPHKA